MYLKQLTIKNYRKYNSSNNVIKFAHSSWGNGKKTEQYISESSSLLIGKNNSGKSTIVNLLNTLQQTKAGSKNVFKHCDFNLTYLKKWYKENFQNICDSNNGKQNNILPSIEFNLKIGIDSKDDIISVFQDVLVISDVTKTLDKEDEGMDIDIIVKYEVTDTRRFINDMNKIKKEYESINIDNLGIDKSKLDCLSSDGETKLSEHEQISINDFKKVEKELEEGKDKDNNLEKEKLVEIGRYYQEKMYRDFLNLLDKGYYTLNFYALCNDEPAKSFSLSALLKVKTVQANTVKDNNTLSKAYNKIINTYIERHGLLTVDEFINDVNIQLKREIDGNIKGILQNAANNIESKKNLNMNLQPDISLDKILRDSVLYEYKEGENYIPESQYGMGYTNLMVIIAEIVEYFEMYEREDTNGAINILCIEEPETFMHPEMQELFIKNIAKAISSLMPKDKNSKNDTFQIIITTHSSHIMNSKIQSGNTLNNIVYLNSNGIKNIEDKSITKELCTSTGENSKLVFEFIKKYIRLELTDIFYAEAVILVEGQTEETYLRYLIDKDPKLNTHHVKVYRIDGAHGYQFLPLLKILNVETVIITDLDINRTEEQKNTYELAKNLNDYSYDEFNNKEKYISTNQTILNIFGKNKNKNNYTSINSEIITKIDKKPYLKKEFSEHIHVFSQGRIQGNYATSFEEAMILTNANNDSKENTSLINLLKKVHQKLVSDFGKDADELVKNSYRWQKKLSDSKSKFASELVYKSIVEDDFNIEPPEYIKEALKLIKRRIDNES